MDKSLLLQAAYMEGLEGKEMTEAPYHWSTNDCEEIMKSYQEGTNDAEDYKNSGQNEMNP